MNKNILLNIALLFAGFLKAQDAGTLNMNFNHLALTVKDIDRSAGFTKKF